MPFIRGIYATADGRPVFVSGPNASQAIDLATSQPVALTEIVEEWVCDLEVDHPRNRRSPNANQAGGAS